MADLSKVSERDKLKAQGEPHWHRLRAGCFVGFRPSKRGGAGGWVARAYDEDARHYRQKALGDFGALTGAERFAAAKKEAETFAALLEAGGEVRPELETVADACRAYGKTRPEAEARFGRYLYGEPLAKVKLTKLRKRHLRDWRDKLEATPALITRNKGGETQHRTRAASTVNRDLVALRAALGAVLQPGMPGTDAAWQEALRPARHADGRRTLTLDLNERRRLLAAADDEVGPFLRGLCLLPLRPGALAGLKVADFDKRTAELTIAKDKDGKARRIVVPAAAAALLGEQAKGKLPGAALFMRANGQPWNKDAWKKPIRQAVKAAGLPSGATAYTLRHSVITDLVRQGLPLLTIAQISGTSAEMIERHYGHLAKDAATKALAELSL